MKQEEPKSILARMTRKEVDRLLDPDKYLRRKLMRYQALYKLVKRFLVHKDKGCPQCTEEQCNKLDELEQKLLNQLRLVEKADD